MAKAEKIEPTLPLTSVSKDTGSISREKAQPRRSKELVIAFCGPLGSGVSTVARRFAEILENYNYSVETVKISDFISNMITSYPKAESKDLKSSKANRIQTLQNTGNELRKEFVHDAEYDILALRTIKEIYLKRGELSPPEAIDKKEPSVPKTSYRVAYIVDSLKHPSEVKLLRKVYGNMFYLIGVLCAEPVRQKRLIDKKGIDPADVAHLIERDKSDAEDHGQQLVKTLQYADFFTRNNHENSENLQKALERYMELILGKPAMTPTKHEYAMFVAQSAALRSACLSRQVGASILSPKGEVISTGCNDVPKKGGLYSTDDQADDLRCKNIQDGECFNDKYKEIIREEIKEVLLKTLKDTEEPELETLAKEISDKTRLKDLLEFSRAIHAEMDAITSVARNGSIPLKGSALYTTLFPCHVCARHIVASGVNEVYYIEPYEKSLADFLHHDSICLEPAESETPTRKVKFLHFEGVAPMRYFDLFLASEGRKKDGKLVKANLREAYPVIPKYLDSHFEIEARIVDYLSQFDKLN